MNNHNIYKYNCRDCFYSKMDALDLDEKRIRPVCTMEEQFIDQLDRCPAKDF